MNEDILGGLKSALTRGYSLEEAMLSFYNAGYKREDIEEAAKALQIQSEHAPAELQPEPIWMTRQKLQGKAISTQSSSAVQIPSQKEQKVIVQPIQETSVNVELPKSKSTPEAPSKTNKSFIFQKQNSKGVSEYSNTDSRIKTITIILVVLLLILLGILGIIFVFKQQIIDFFNGLF